MALRSTFQGQAPTSQDISEHLEALEKRMERAKVLYEQYFLGIQKIPPDQLHRDLERRFRELTQLHIRNTALRFRFTTLSQKFGSYNTYWKRTLRQIEQGTYLRDLARVGRQAARRGQDVPDELLARMPKRMRDRILRDRERLARRAEREQAAEQGRGETAAAEQAAEQPREPAKVKNPQKNVHHIDASDLLDDVDLDAIFSQITEDGPKGGAAATAPTKAAATGVRSLEPPAKSPAAVTPPKQPRAATVPPPIPRAARPSAPTKPPPGMSEGEARQLYERYKKARELVGERTDNLTYDKLMRSLNKQAPKILEDKAASKVHFNVVVKGDKVVLKAKTEK